MIRNHTVSDRPVSGESRGLRSSFQRRRRRLTVSKTVLAAALSGVMPSHWPLDMALQD
uniref:Uncharacterized protein n=1 Tax=Nothobranchius pienaari TaxID=704102 RepID=A0A1A8PCP6_9TELE